MTSSEKKLSEGGFYQSKNKVNISVLFVNSKFLIMFPQTPTPYIQWRNVTSGVVDFKLLI